MEWYQVTLLVLVVVIAALYLYKKFTGTDVLKMIVMSRPVVVALTTVIEAVYNIVPNNTLKAIKMILNAAVHATEVAEKAWLMGELSREERNPVAKALAREVLEKAGIVVTAQVDAIINGVIEMTCMVLPHGVKPKQQSQESVVIEYEQ